MSAKEILTPEARLAEQAHDARLKIAAGIATGLALAGAGYEAYRVLRKHLRSGDKSSHEVPREERVKLFSFTDEVQNIPDTTTLIAGAIHLSAVTSEGGIARHELERRLELEPEATEPLLTTLAESLFVTRVYASAETGEPVSRDSNVAKVEVLFPTPDLDWAHDVYESQPLLYATAELSN